MADYWQGGLRFFFFSSTLFFIIHFGTLFGFQLDELKFMPYLYLENPTTIFEFRPFRVPFSLLILCRSTSWAPHATLPEMSVAR